MELLSTAGGAAVRKTYRNTGRGLLQTFLRKSRAEREFGNLGAVCRAGVPCTEPLRWSRVRRWGLVLQSTLETRFVPDCRSVREILRSGCASREERRWLVAEMGRLTARLHAAGILWCTLTPRNFLVQGPMIRGRLLLCDMPAAVRFARSIHRRGEAETDLYDAAFSASRRSDFSASERRRFLLAYGGGDRTYVRDLGTRLAHRGRSGNRLRKGVRKTFSMYLLPARRLFGRDRRPEP